LGDLGDFWFEWYYLSNGKLRLSLEDGIQLVFGTVQVAKEEIRTDRDHQIKI
jgi:hypothetical protein